MKLKPSCSTRETANCEVVRAEALTGRLRNTSAGLCRNFSSPAVSRRKILKKRWKRCIHMLSMRAARLKTVLEKRTMNECVPSSRRYGVWKLDDSLRSRSILVLAPESGNFRLSSPEQTYLNC